MQRLTIQDKGSFVFIVSRRICGGVYRHWLRFNRPSPGFFLEDGGETRGIKSSPREMGRGVARIRGAIAFHREIVGIEGKSNNSMQRISQHEFTWAQHIRARARAHTHPRARFRSVLLVNTPGLQFSPQCAESELIYLADVPPPPPLARMAGLHFPSFFPLPLPPTPSFFPSFFPINSAYIACKTHV